MKLEDNRSDVTALESNSAEHRGIYRGDRSRQIAVTVSAHGVSTLRLCKLQHQEFSDGL